MSNCKRRDCQAWRWLFTIVLALSPFSHTIADDSDQPDAAPDLFEDLEMLPRSRDNEEVINHLSTRSDIELKKYLDKVLELRHFRSKVGYEPCLLEIVKRGGEDWELLLGRKFDQLMKKELQSHYDPDETEPAAIYNLELLTALRRLQKKPDPLQITITEPTELKGVGADLSHLKVKITNVDVDKVDVGFKFMGNYRGGRQERWRVYVKDQEGKTIPVRGRLDSTAGGLFSESILKYGESWETTLNVRSFIEVPLTGEYELQVLYHNTEVIAAFPDVRGMIVSSSEAIPFIVEPLTITHSKTEREFVHQLVTELDSSKILKVVVGTYGEWAYEFISPETPEGELLSMGFVAVPTLIEALHDKNMTKEKRAWLFGILYSLTGENDPRSSSAMGGFKFWENGWQLWGESSTGGSSGGLSSGRKGMMGWGEIDKNAQEELIKTWDKWLKRVIVKEKASSDLQ